MKNKKIERENLVRQKTTKLSTFDKMGGFTSQDRHEERTNFDDSTGLNEMAKRWIEICIQQIEYSKK